MPRPPRILSSDRGTYHVYNRGNNKLPIFHTDSDYVSFLRILQAAKQKMGFFIHHMALMPNHYHLIFTLPNGTLLSDALKNIDYQYSMRHKKRYNRVGPLWQSRFKHKTITDDSYLLTCGIYIELNPVRAGLVKHPADYMWSSYRHYVTGKSVPLITTNPHYDALGKGAKERRRAYIKLSKMWIRKSTRNVT